MLLSKAFINDFNRVGNLFSTNAVYIFRNYLFSDRVERSNVFSIEALSSVEVFSATFCVSNHNISNHSFVANIVKIITVKWI